MNAIDNLPVVFLTEKRAARLLSISHRTLQAWRRTGVGPAFVKMGRSVRYRQHDVLAWAERHRHSA
jgi:excisionase family DNA binding protein